ncbi:hypothetical protein [Micavibrio aeruginosavorus]|uniref:Uncharacterized protein n=1 Tax=Micavibrio aeruginosavorus EPB TaxID=349215 RepID=M4VI26_9BACT|nr:hypothetical protein [Micavibrio aeruginosavorus]AGH99022.1 hypothetical protein A11S_2226 [Micavibrio aeruginosavorus EPB]
MKALLSVLTAAVVLAAPVAAKADDHAAPATEMKAEVAAETAAPAAAEEVSILTYTLADGTSVVVEADSVFVLDKDGNRTAAPDGEHKTVDGQTLNVKEGKLVKEEAAAPATDAPAAEAPAAETHDGHAAE